MYENPGAAHACSANVLDCLLFFCGNHALCIVLIKLSFFRHSSISDKLLNKIIVVRVLDVFNTIGLDHLEMLHIIFMFSRYLKMRLFTAIFCLLFVIVAATDEEIQCTSENQKQKDSLDRGQCPNIGISLQILSIMPSASFFNYFATF